LVLGAPPASAALPDLPQEVVKTAGSTIESVTTTPPASPTETSAAPEPTSNPVEPTPESTSTASGAVAGPVNSATENGGADLPPAGGVENGAEESMAAAGAGSAEATPTAPASTSGSPAAVPRSGDRHGDKTGLGDGKRLHQAESGPVGWFLTYVWPAVALEKAEALPAVLVASLEAIDPLPRPEAGKVASGLDRPQPDTTPPSDQPSPSALPHGHFALPVVASLSSPLKIVLYLSMSILLAALAFTVWAQFSAATRRHHWGG
jgi:hypothetical protein